MKNKSKELDVDFIGGQGPLTKEEEQAISEYLKSRKLPSFQKRIPKTKTSLKRKVVA